MRAAGAAGVHSTDERRFADRPAIRSMLLDRDRTLRLLWRVFGQQRSSIAMQRG